MQLAERTFIFLLLLAFAQPETQAQTLSDIDGNIYNTISIGSQTWMRENLKTVHFANGDAIPTTGAPIDNDPAAVYQWAYNDNPAYVNIYGRLYTWYAVTDSRNVCPAGWHVPSDTELETLADFLGGDSIAGNKMKETGTLHWDATNAAVDNASGFTALPGGFRGNPSGFVNIGRTGMFWSATPFGTSPAFQRGNIFNLQSNQEAMQHSVAVANCGLSVRCLQNTATGRKGSSLKDRVQLFPNPATDEISVSLKDYAGYHLFIYDIKGALVLQQELPGHINRIGIGSLPKGLYLVRIAGPGGTAARKLIKE